MVGGPRPSRETARTGPPRNSRDRSRGGRGAPAPPAKQPEPVPRWSGAPAPHRETAGTGPNGSGSRRPRPPKVGTEVLGRDARARNCDIGALPGRPSAMPATEMAVSGAGRHAPPAKRPGPVPNAPAPPEVWPTQVGPPLSPGLQARTLSWGRTSGGPSAFRTGPGCFGGGAGRPSRETAGEGFAV